MMCNCIELSNAKLAKHNTKLDMQFYLNPKTPKRVTIATSKIDKKKRLGPVSLVGGYCPFCGEEIKDATAETKP